MNAFADWLFSILLGWTGTAANSAWNAVVNAAGGISTFFSRFWLPIVLLLILGGVMMDYIVWFARWRPYLVWRSWFTRRKRRRAYAEDAHQLEHGDMDAGTLNTIADWVATPQDQYPVYDLPGTAYEEEQWAAPHPDWAAPEQSEHWAHMAADQENQPPPPSYGATWQQPAMQPYAQPYPYSQPPPEPASQQTAFQHPFEAQQPGDWFAQGPADMNQQEAVEPPSPQQPRRRRRSERSRQRITRDLLETLRSRLSQAEDDEGMIDGLPSPVREEDAFHEAVYPQNYRYHMPHSEQQPPHGWQEDGRNGT